VAVKVAEVQNMARHVLRNALVLWLSGQHLNRPCKSGEATKATGKQKWPTLRNVGIRYRVGGVGATRCKGHPNCRIWLIQAYYALITAENFHWGEGTARTTTLAEVGHLTIYACFW
jgi:hypothetical protein